MHICDYLAMCEGAEIDMQKTLAIQRHFVTCMVQPHVKKGLSHKDIIFLSLYDKTDEVKTNELVNRLFEKELKRKKAWQHQN